MCIRDRLLSKQIVSFLELRKKSLNLLDALSALHKQEGILSVCSYCREVKNEDGDWMHLEKYLSKVSDIRFSHGVCDICMEKHFPDVVEGWNKKGPFWGGAEKVLRILKSKIYFSTESIFGRIYI